MKFLFLISGENRDDINMVVREVQRIGELIKDSMSLLSKDCYDSTISSFDELYSKDGEDIFILNSDDIFNIQDTFKSNFDYYPIYILLGKTSNMKTKFTHVINCEHDNLLPVANKLFSILKYYDDNKYTFEKAYYLNSKIKED